MSKKPLVRVIDARHQELDGVVYNLDYLLGYFRNRKIVDGKLKVRILHVDMYTMHYGKPPEGFEVHHHDENKSNNVIGNLYCMAKGAHTTLHNLRRGNLPESTRSKMSASATARWQRWREEKLKLEDETPCNKQK